jgi:hypothetical protein
MYQRFGKTHLESEGLTFYSYCLYCQFSRSKIRQYIHRVGVLYDSQNKQRILPYTRFNYCFFIKEMASICCAERTGCLNKTNYVSSLKGQDAVHSPGLEKTIINREAF